MNLLEIKRQVMFQTNNDTDDLGEFLPHLTDYINDGYDRLVLAWAGEHADEDSERFTPMLHDRSVPALPEWTHRALADWATWLVYRNGSAPRQNRGAVFRRDFEMVQNRLRAMSGKRFVNLPE